jgi:hypothetical protein
MFLLEITQGEVTDTVVCTVLLFSAIFVRRHSSRMLATPIPLNTHEVPQFGQSALKQVCVHLESCWDKDSVRYPEMVVVWEEQIRPVIDAYMLRDDGSLGYQTRELGVVLIQLMRFHDTYADYLPRIDSDSITSFIKLTESEVYFATACSLIDDATRCSEPLRRVKKFRKSIEFLFDGSSQYFQAAIFLSCGDRFLNSYRGFLAYILGQVEIDSRSVRPNDRNKFNQIRRIIDMTAKALMWELERLMDGRTAELKFVVDLDYERQLPTIYDADSPEGKAITRLSGLGEEPDEFASDEEWDIWRSKSGISTGVEIGREIDKEALLERLRKGGVKI